MRQTKNAILTCNNCPKDHHDHRPRKMSDAIVHHGYLVKRAVGKRWGIGKQFPSWRRRYLILGESELTWHEQAEVSEIGDVTVTSKRLGELPLSKECVLTENADSTKGKLAYTFSLKSGAYKLVLQAASEEERQEWVTNIRNVIQQGDSTSRSKRKLAMRTKVDQDSPRLAHEADPPDDEADVETIETEGAEGQAEEPSPILSNPPHPTPLQSNPIHRTSI